MPVIASPTQGTTFQAGDTLVFSGSASDPEDGTEPSTRLTWWVELHHDTHTHPFQPATTGAGKTGGWAHIQSQLTVENSALDPPASMTRLAPA